MTDALSRPALSVSAFTVGFDLYNFTYVVEKAASHEAVHVYLVRNFPVMSRLPLREADGAGRYCQSVFKEIYPSAVREESKRHIEQVILRPVGGQLKSPFENIQDLFGKIFVFNSTDPGLKKFGYFASLHFIYPPMAL